MLVSAVFCHHMYNHCGHCYLVVDMDDWDELDEFLCEWDMSRDVIVRLKDEKVSMLS